MLLRSGVAKVYRSARMPQCATGLKCLPTNDDGTGPAMCATKPPSSRWVIGVVISVIGGVVLNLGLNLQKLSFRRAAAILEPARPPPYRQPIWVVGFTVWILANLASFVALSFAAQSLIAALGAVSLVANAVAAPLINKEPFGKLDALAIVLISTGTVVIVAFASHDEAEYTLCALMLFYRRPSVIAYLTVNVAMIVGLWVFIRIMDAQLARIERARVLVASPPRHASVAAASGTDSDRDTPAVTTSKTLHRQSTASVASVTPTLRASSSSTISSVASTRPLARTALGTTPTPRWLARVGPTSVAARYLLPLAYAALGGMLGGLTVLLAKSAAELIVTTAQGENQFRFVATYLILVGIAVTGVGQVVYINAGLQRYDALVQVPAFYVVYTLCGIVSGGLYFDEFHALSGTQFALFSVGVVLTFLGVACLAGRLRQTTSEPPAGSATLVRDNDVPLDALGRPDWDAYDARLGKADTGTVASPVPIDDGDGVTVGPGARSPSPNALVHRLARQRMPSDVLFLTGEPIGSGSGDFARFGVEAAAAGNGGVEPPSPGRAMSPRLRAAGG
ncbi:NIPA-like protein 3 [Allomyces arbusculus]|nr:NIPA-like protein 3 [Allomyces arbusculus]